MTTNAVSVLILFSLGLIVPFSSISEVSDSGDSVIPMAETRNSQLIRKAMKESKASLNPQIQTMFTEQNAKIDKSIADLFEALRLHTAAMSDRQSAESERTSGTILLVRRLTLELLTLLIMLDFPRFSGDNIKEWLCKIEQLFAIDHTPEELKVGLASIHFNSEAATWHQSIALSDCQQAALRDWSTYKELLKEHFGEILDDPIAELKALQETDGIIEYHNRFELIRTRISLLEEYLHYRKNDICPRMSILTDSFFR